MPFCQVNLDTQQSRRTWWIAIVGVIPFLVLAARHWEYGPLAAFGDWAQYMLHADALRHGRPYADIGYIFTAENPFIGPPVQPPGLPASLVPLLALTDGARDSVLYKVFMVAWTLSFLALVMLYFGRLGNRTLGVVTAAVTGLWLEGGYATNVVQPDIPFCTILWGTFYLADSHGGWSWTRVTGITLLAFAALAFRLAAVPLFPALLLYALLHRHEQRIRLWIPIATFVVCGLAAAMAVPDALTFARLMPLDLSGLTEHIVEAVKLYPLGAFDIFLYPFPWNRANDAYHLLAIALTLVGAVAWARHAARWLLTLFAPLYVGMLMVLPMQDGRYLMPIAPLIVYSAACGAMIVIRWLARRRMDDVADRRARLVTVVAFACLVVAGLGRELTRPRPIVLLDAPGVQRLIERLRTQHAAAPTRVVFVNPRVLTWRTGIPAMGFIATSPDSTLLELRSKRITHLVLGDLGTGSTHFAAMQHAVNARQSAFRPLYAEGPFTVYAFAAARAGATP
jgi:hypothetical protein